LTEVLYIVILLSGLGIFHTYVFYPLHMLLGSNKKTSSEITISHNHTVAILVAAYNEEKVIGEKLKSIFNSDYSLDKISVYIGSDASTDATNQIIEDFSKQHPNIQLTNFKGRTGKAAIINYLASQAKENILILTDANVFFTPTTVSELVKHFNNENIHQVCANILKVSDKNSGIQPMEKTYLNLENKIKAAESHRWEIVMGAEGACYAIRKNKYNPVPPNYFMDDFYITMGVLDNGGKVIFEEKAICYEDLPSMSAEEHKRKIRISIGNYQNLSVYKHLLWPPWKGLGYAFLSHKVLRWLTPFFLITIFICTIILAWQSKIMMVLAVVQLFLFLLPLVIRCLHKIKPLLFVAHFYNMNLALLKGFFIYSKGVKSSVWEPTKRNA